MCTCFFFFFLTLLRREWHELMLDTYGLSQLYNYMSPLEHLSLIWSFSEAE